MPSAAPAGASSCGGSEKTKPRASISVTQVVLFVKTTSYTKRINLEQIARRTLDQRLNPNAFRSLAKIVHKLNRSGAQRSLF